MLISFWAWRDFWATCQNKTTPFSLSVFLFPASFTWRRMTLRNTEEAPRCDPRPSVLLRVSRSICAVESLQLSATQSAVLASQRL